MVTWYVLLVIIYKTVYKKNVPYSSSLLHYYPTHNISDPRVRFSTPSNSNANLLVLAADPTGERLSATRLTPTSDTTHKWWAPGYLSLLFHLTMNQRFT